MNARRSEFRREAIKHVPSPPGKGEKVADRPDEGGRLVRQCTKKSPLTLPSPPNRLRRGDCIIRVCKPANDSGERGLANRLCAINAIVKCSTVLAR